MTVGSVYKENGLYRIRFPDGKDYLLRIADDNGDNPELEKYVGWRCICEGTILNSVGLGLNFFAVRIELDQKSARLP